MLNLTFTPPRAVYIAGQILGIVIVFISFLVFLPKKRSKILIMKLISDILDVVQSLMIGAVTGAGIALVGTGREAVFYNRGRKKWASSRFWLCFFLVLYCITPIFTWQGAISILPAIGSILAMFSFYCRKPQVMRTLSFIGHFPTLAYCIVVFNIGAILGIIVQLVSIIIGFIRGRKVTEDNAENGLVDDKVSVFGTTDEGKAIDGEQ